MAVAIGYLLAVALLQFARHGGHGPAPTELASSPAAVMAGRGWTLLTSGLVVAGNPVVQLSVTSATVMAVLALLGPRTFWVAAFFGHVVATVISYFGLGAAWLVAGVDVDAVAHTPDYGISCVFAGALGALTAHTVRRGRRSWAGVAAGAAVLVVALPPTADLTGAQHLLAFLLGVGVGMRRAAPARPAAGSGEPMGQTT